ncbi:hypothetical protein F5Y04DRAFT_284018 [Hypomontagnella monticulosa]|nr:hypothetical protein F5Y04DRAFT_284018 [Hypomontagnella monticulosa]
MFSEREQPSKRRRYTSIDEVPPQTEPEFFIRAISQVKDGLELDDRFLGWTPLNDVPQDDSEFDCVAISGIGSHPFGSWQPHGGNKEFMWIRDTLPNVLPQSRMILYGYDTDMRQSTSFQKIEDIAISLVKNLRLLRDSSMVNRGLIFLAHSLGGIVLKQALVSLAESKGMIEWAIAETLTGAIFFGVPNHGMEISHLRAITDGKPNRGLIKQLRCDAPFLRLLEDKFSQQVTVGRFSKMSFFWGYETKESKVVVRNPADRSLSNMRLDAPQLKLVQRDSATRGLWRNAETQSKTFQIDEDHSSIVKFKTAHDPNLKIVVSLLHEISGIASTTHLDSGEPAVELKSSPNPLTILDHRSSQSLQAIPRTTTSLGLSEHLSNIPRMSIFGRDNEIDSLKTLLQPSNTSMQRTVSVYGQPGIGKTQTVLHFIERHGDVYDSIFWLNAATNRSLRGTLSQEVQRLGKSWSDYILHPLSRRDNHTANIERFVSFLNSDVSGCWLLVIDDILDPDMSRNIIKSLKKGDVVLISTVSLFGGDPFSIKIGPIAIPHAIKMILESVPIEEKGTNPEHLYRPLLEYLDYHPSLIRLAMEKLPRCKTVGMLIERFRFGQAKLPWGFWTNINSILTIEDPKTRSPITWNRFLQLCVLLDGKTMSYELLEFLGLSDYLLPFTQIIQRLAKYGLVETRVSRDQKITCCFSAILCQFIRQSMVRPWFIVSEVANFLAKKVPRSSKEHYRKAVDILGPHVEAFAEWLIARAKLVTPTIEDLDNMERLASLLRLRGNDSRAIEIYGLVYHLNTSIRRTRLNMTETMKERQLSLPRARLAELYNNMGISSLNEGNIVFAMTCFTRAEVEVKEAEISATRTQIMIEIMVNKVWAHMAMEEHEKAHTLVQAGIIEFCNEDVSVLLLLKHASGVTHLAMGQVERGCEILAEVLETAQQHPQVGKRLIFAIMHDSAVAYMDKKNWKKAVSLLENTREGRESFHGADHRLTLESTAALAVAYQHYEDQKKAKGCFRKALTWQRERLPPNHPETLRTLQNYGIFQHSIGDHEGSRKALQLAYAGYVEHDKKMNICSWGRINAAVSLAITLKDLKRYEDSSILFSEALDWYHSGRDFQTLKIRHQRAKTAFLQGAMYEESGNHDRALDSYELAEEGFKSFEGSPRKHWQLMTAKAITRLLSLKKDAEHNICEPPTERITMAPPPNEPVV